MGMDTYVITGPMTNNRLVCAGGKAVPAYGDPGKWLDTAIARATGRIFCVTMNIADVTKGAVVGFDINKAAHPSSSSMATINSVAPGEGGSWAPAIYTLFNATEYKFAITLTAAGAHYWIYDSNWIYLGHWGSDATATLYAAIANYAAAFDADNLSVSQDLWLPAPLASDGFGTVPAAVAMRGTVDNGMHEQVGLTGGGNGAFYDGVNSYTDIYSASLNTAYDPDETSVIMRGKIPATAWLDGSARTLIGIQADVNNEIFIRKGTVDNQIQFIYQSGGTSNPRSKGSVSTANWITLGITASKIADEVKAYFDGSQEGATINGLGIWAGALSATGCCIGATTTGPTNPWHGWLSDAIIGLSGANIASPADMSTIHTRLDAGTLVPVHLDAIFGYNLWAWWKLDEEYSTDGLGHAEGVATGVGEGGANDVYTQDGTFANNGSGAMVNAPVAGSEEVTNGDFANWTGDDPDNWTIVDGGAYADVTEVATGEGHAAAPTPGGGFCNIYRSGGGSDADPKISQVVYTAGQWYLTSINVDTRTSGTIWVRDSNNGIFMSLSSTGTHIVIDRALVASLLVNTAADPTDITFDDLSVKQLTLDELFSTLSVANANVQISVDVTLTTRTQAGVVMNLDSAVTPANFVIAYHDGSANCRLDKCVAGTYTNVISAAAAYSAGKTLRVQKNGTAYRLYYNDALVGAGTISDAGIVSNTIHGLFSTYSANTLDDLVIYETGTDGEHN